MYIGFNVRKVEELIDAVVDDYNSLGIYTADQWGAVKDTLRREWIGPDEQDFEQKLVARICSLYNNSYNLAKACAQTLAELADKWVKFQQGNVLDGANNVSNVSGVGSISSKISEFLNGNVSPSLKNEPNIIEFVGIGDFGADVNRGLQNSGSKANIQSAVSTFVNTVKSKTQDLFNSIQTNNAFFGEQSGAIKSYIEACGQSIADVTTAVKDLNDALEQLASSTYSTASTDIQTSYATNKTNVEAVTEQLGNSRWTA